MRRFRLSAIRATADHRARGYYDDVVNSGRVDGDWLVLSDEAFRALQRKYSKPVSLAEWPAWADLLAVVRRDADSGVGDTIARIIGPVCGGAFKKWYRAVFGRSCGCAGRQESFNRRYPYEVDNPPLLKG